MSASEIHARLEAALRELKRAENNAVLLFGEILSRKLEQTVRATRKRARKVSVAAGQPSLDLADLSVDPLPTDAPIIVNTKYTSAQCARHEALLETIRKRGGRKDSPVRGMDRAELVLAALSDLAEKLVQGTETKAAAASPYQVVVYMCKTCGKSEAQTDRGPKPISTEVVQCDAVIKEPGQPNRSTIPPKARQAAMIRANHRCETPGCGRTRFLEVHHRRPRSQGGGHEADNLQVSCSACHQLVHQPARLIGSR